MLKIKLLQGFIVSIIFNLNSLVLLHKHMKSTSINNHSLILKVQNMFLGLLETAHSISLVCL